MKPVYQTIYTLEQFASMIISSYCAELQKDMGGEGFVNGAFDPFCEKIVEDVVKDMNQPHCHYKIEYTEY